jgi:hypothetical protein
MEEDRAYMEDLRARLAVPQAVLPEVSCPVHPHWG